jgi:hypothetical protein
MYYVKPTVVMVSCYQWMLALSLTMKWAQTSRETFRQITYHAHVTKHVITAQWSVTASWFLWWPTGVVIVLVSGCCPATFLLRLEWVRVGWISNGTGFRGLIARGDDGDVWGKVVSGYEQGSLRFGVGNGWRCLWDRVSADEMFRIGLSPFLLFH